MNTVYIECAMGAAGDMLAAALLELVPDAEATLARLNALQIPGVKFARQTAEKCGVQGTHFCVTVQGEEEHSHDAHHEHTHKDHTHSHEEHSHAHSEHTHTYEEHSHTHSHETHGHVHSEHTHTHSHAPHQHNTLHDIAHILHHLPVSDAVRTHALAVYGLIAEAESKAHGKPVELVHFHEVGALDAVADVVAVCILLEELGNPRVVASPVHVGSGHVHCAHGILPVPAPATAHILQGVPTYGGDVQGELCTPTGAALLRHFADSFGAMPVMVAQGVGYGMGKKDFARANCVRAFLGQTQHIEQKPQMANESLTQLACNVDDMTGEAMAYALQRLLDAGAKDAFAQPILMKKGRPAYLLQCLCADEQADALAALMLTHTTSIGVRRTQCTRYAMQRSEHTVETPYGAVRIKETNGYGTKKQKPEFDDVARLATQHGVPMTEILRHLPF